MSMIYIRQIEVGDMANFVYLVGDKEKAECVMIDPAWEVDRVLEVADKDGMKVTAGILTHTHFDHCNGVEDLTAEIQGPIYVHENEAEGLESLGKRVHPTHDGFKIPVGDLEIHCLHTPGHTPGSQCFLISGNLFSGDTLFVDACGRCDLPGGSPEKMYESLQRLAKLPEDTALYPGHDYGEVQISSIGREKKQNPYYQPHSLKDFLRQRMGF